jgi:hypothetical protein
MNKTATYRAQLKTLSDWAPFLLQESGLPGPRGNLELAAVVADEGTADFFEYCLTFTPERAPVNSPEEFLAFCGIVGLGRLLAEGHDELLPRLLTSAADPRWRTREGVAMALQRLGDADMPRLIAAMDSWADGNPWEQRAAAAALAEPRLLKDPAQVTRVLQIMDRITVSIAQSTDRRAEAFKVLRQGMAYCWSVAVAALPEQGQPLMEKWCAGSDRDIRWIMKENLKKKRLERLDPAWTARWLEYLEQ